MTEKAILETPADKSFYVCGKTYQELEAALREYEIKNIVRFACSRGSRYFNAEYEPWKSFSGSLPGPKLMWGSDSVPGGEQPYVTVARKVYSCQYGKQRHTKVLKGTGSFQSYKIGCPAVVEMVEVLRLLKPKIRPGINGNITKYHKRELAIKYHEHVERSNNGLSHELVWEREFHLNISPISSHSHVTGQGAAEHQRVDQQILDRIHQLASSGITASDVIRDHLIHYVEEEMFKGKESPLKTNRRFYPNSRDIRNHVYLVKNSHVAKKRKVAPENSEEDMPSTSITEEGVVYHNGQVVEVARYESVEPYEQHQTFEQQSQQYFANNGFTEFSSTGNTQEYVDVSSYSTVTTTEKSPRKARVTGITTRPASSKGRFRNPKEKFIGLVKKLHRIANAIESTNDMSKLTASIINTIMLAKPMVPEDKIGVLYEEEPRTLLYPRRNRIHKKKPPAPRKQRYPAINPDAIKLPDKKVLKAEAKKKREEAAKAKKAAMLAEGDRLLSEAADKRKIQANFTKVKFILPETDGQPAPKVLLLNNSKQTNQVPVVLQKPGEGPVLQQFTIKHVNFDTKGISTTLIKNPNIKTTSLTPTNQSLIGVVNSAATSSSNTVSGATNTPFHTLGVVTEKKNSAAPYTLVNYCSILPKKVVGSSNSAVIVIPKENVTIPNVSSAQCAAASNTSGHVIASAVTTVSTCPSTATSITYSTATTTTPLTVNSAPINTLSSTSKALTMSTEVVTIDNL